MHGVGGGTCQWAAQMARLKGYKVIGTVAEGKAETGRATGCHELIVLKEVPGKSFEDYESVDVVAKVMLGPATASSLPGACQEASSARHDVNWLALLRSARSHIC